MTDEQNIVYAQSRIVCALIRAMAMQAENMQRQMKGESMAYNDTAFINLIEEEGIHHNAIIGLLTGR